MYQQGEQVYLHDGAVCTVWQEPVEIQGTFAYWLEQKDGNIRLVKEEDIAGRFPMPQGGSDAQRLPGVQSAAEPPMQLYPGCTGTDETFE
jgi:hypothetical protein